MSPCTVINPILLTYLLPIETLHILLDIINETWKSDTFPESWREALIISIPKPGKDHFNPLNYRPIALTSCICKTVERMVNERLVWYLEKNGLLAKQECGYRANRSTVDHLVRLETFIRDAFIQNQHLVAVFFDSQKAYDTTWKCGILQDLYDMGLRGNLPIFIGKFLSDRTFQVHLGTILSDKIFHHEEGVPQGAILSTTLFNVKINNIVKWPLGLNVRSMWMTLLLCTTLPLSMLSKGNCNILSTGLRNGPFKMVLPFLRIRLLPCILSRQKMHGSCLEIRQ